MVTGRLLALLGAVEPEKHLASGIRFKRTQELQSKKLSHSWEKNKFKIYPSSLSSLTMCPKRFVEVDVHKGPGWQVETEYSMANGRAIHTMLQTEVQDIKNFLYPAPTFENVPEFFPGFRESLQRKYEIEFPEVPVADFECGISGRADLILNVRGKPVLVDIKTTHVPDVIFNEKTQEFEKDRWATAKKKYPDSKHRIQVAIYAYYMNLYKYYDKPIETAGLAYINTAIRPGLSEAEHETYFEVTPELLSDVGKLLTSLKAHRTAYLEGKQIPCTYERCREHTKRSTEDASP